MTKCSVSLEALACVTSRLQKKIVKFGEQFPTCIMHYYWSWIIFYWRFLYACLKMDSPVCWPETLGDSHWLRSSGGKPTSLKSQPWCRFGFPNCRPKCTKGPIVSSLTHRALAVLVAVKAVTSSNCRGAFGLVWFVCCWHHPPFSWRHGAALAKMVCVRKMFCSSHSAGCSFLLFSWTHCIM